MKIKLIISVFLMLTVLAVNIVVPASAETDNTSVSANSFFEQAQEFANKYEPGAVSSGDITELPLNRLIVKTESNIPLEDTYGAVDLLEGFNGIHILQYRSETDTENAYINFYNNSIVEYVDYDSWICVESSLNKCTCNDLTCNNANNCDTIRKEENKLFCTCKDISASNNHLSWNSSAIMVDQAFEYLLNKNIEFKEVKVAVLDTGLYANHTDFDATRIDIDQDYKFSFNGDYCSSAEDGHYHGTHVAGIIYNNTMNNIKITPYRIFESSTAYLEYSVFCMALNAAIENNVDVINMSIRIKAFDDYIYVAEDGTIVGTTKEDIGAVDAAEFMEDMLDRAISKNIVLVVSAGNKTQNVSNDMPASYKEAITVAATTRDNMPDYSYSNYGLGVDIAAPGTDIYSTVPWVPLDISGNAQNHTFESLHLRDSGTSMAAPLVSAAAALLKSIDPV